MGVKTGEHPIRKTGRVLLGVGGAMVAVGIGGGTVLGPVLGGGAVGLLPCGVLFAGLGVYSLTAGALVPLVNEAVREIGLGRIERAEGLLEAAETGFGARLVARHTQLARAAIALQRGDLTAALARVEASMAVSLGLLGRPNARLQRTDAQSYRALLRGALGDAEGARGDIDAVRKSSLLLTAAEARASLAEALLFERAGDRAALGALLDRDRELLFEATSPRERALARGLFGLLRSSPGKGYREAAPDTGSSEAQDLSMADWVAKLAPSVAPFVESRAPRTPGFGESVAFDPVDARAAEATSGLPQAAAKKAPGAGLPLVKRVALLWGLLIFLFVGIWQFAGPSPAAGPSRGRAPVADSSSPLLSLGPLLGLLFLVVFCGNLAFFYRRNRRRSEQLLQAQSLLARGKLDEAERMVTRLASEGPVLSRAWALLLLSTVGERRGGLARALTHCEEGLALVAGGRWQSSAFDALLPALHAQRAFLLAARGRDAEATAEAAHLGATFPSYVARASAEYRVRLCQLLRRGDDEGAARLVEQRPADLPLGMREQLLSDLVLALQRPAAKGERSAAENVREELRASPAAEAWIEAVAPGLIETL